MIIACPACSTRYVVPDSAIGVEGRTVRCAKCRHSWHQDGPELVPPAKGEKAPDPATPEPDARPTSAAETTEQAPEQPPDPEPQTEPETETKAEAVPEPQPDQVSAREVRASAAAASTPIVYDDDEEAAFEEDDEGHSNFEHSPPFRPRRNIARILMIAAVLFAAIALAATAYVWKFGLPDWVPAPRSTFAEAQPDLILDFPPKRQDRRTLPNGTEYFGASGTVTNVGSSDRSVPSILIVMRDSRDRIVYSWEVAPPKPRLSPGESVNINEAVTDVPKSAVAAEIGWKPG